MPRRGENIRKRKDGRWEGRYIKKRNVDGKAIYGSVYAKTYIDVKRKLTEMNKLVLDKALPTKQQQVAFKEVLYLWLENNSIKLKPQTYADYKYVIEKHILPTIGSISISKLEASHINAFIQDKNKRGRLDDKGGLSGSYIKKMCFIINSSIEYAIKKGYRQTNCGGLIYPAKNLKKMEVLSVNEQLMLESYLMFDLDERKLGILLSLYGGLRIGEICGLRWGDIDFREKTIHIRHTVERIKNIDAEFGENKTKLILGDTKTFSSNRVIPIPPKLLCLLVDRKKGNDVFLVKGNKYDYVDPRSYQYCFRKYLNNCNMRKINFHALRHTFATRCIESGMDVKSLSEILGHANVNITLNTYVHSSLEHKRNQLETMSIYCGQ